MVGLEKLVKHEYLGVMSSAYEGVEEMIHRMHEGREYGGPEEAVGVE